MDGLDTTTVKVTGILNYLDYSLFLIDSRSLTNILIKLTLTESASVTFLEEILQILVIFKVTRTLELSILFVYLLYNRVMSYQGLVLQRPTISLVGC